MYEEFNFLKDYPLEALPCSNEYMSNINWTFVWGRCKCGRLDFGGMGIDQSALSKIPK